MTQKLRPLPQHEVIKILDANGLGPVTIWSTNFLSEKSSNTGEAISRFSKLKQIEPIGYTTDEINIMLNEGNTFIENILREGKEIKLM